MLTSRCGGGRRSILDAIMPHPTARERHHIRVPEPAARAIGVATRTTWREMPLTRVLMLVGPSRADRRVFDDLRDQLGFVELERAPDELVLGTILRLPAGRPRRLPEGPGARRAFESFSGGNHVKIGFNLRYEDGELVTETRVLGTSAASRLVFRAYWAVIWLGSGLTRIEWLRAVRRSLDTNQR